MYEEPWSLDTAASIYEASPECRERRCSVSLNYDIVNVRFAYQHNERPEAVLLIDRFTARHDPAADVRQRFREFAERCHRYEDGLPVEAE